MATGYKFEWKKRSVHKRIQIICVVVMLIIFINIFRCLTLMCQTENLLTDLENIRSATQHLIMLELFGLERDAEFTDIDNYVKRLENITINNNWNSELNNTQTLRRISTEWMNLKLYLDDYRIDKDGILELIQANEVYASTINDMTKALVQYRTNITNDLTISLSMLIVLFVVLIIVSLPQNMNEIQLIRKNRELEVAAYIDKITGLPSRRSCEEKIWMPINPNRAPYCVVIFDLNNLKKVNDAHGHHQGDKLIKGFATILETISNDRIFAGRYGGDEFILIAHGYSEERIRKLLNKIELKVEDHNIKNSHPQIHYAVGYAFEGGTLREMIDLADERMYVNKKAMKDEKLPVVKYR